MPEQSISNVVHSLAFGICGLLALIGNTINIIVITKSKIGNSTLGLLLANLAVVDICLGLSMVIFISPSCYLEEFPYSPSIMQIYGNLNIYFITEAVYIICVLSVERTFAVGDILSYRKYFNRTNVVLIIVLLWILNLTVLILGICLTEELIYDKFRNVVHPYVSSKDTTSACLDVMHVYLPGVITITSSCKIILTSLKQRRLVHSMVESRFAREMSMTIQLAPMTLIALVSALPTIVLEYIRYYKGLEHMNKEFLFLCTLLFYSNSVFNGFIYNVTMKSFKNETKRILQRKDIEITAESLEMEGQWHETSVNVPENSATRSQNICSSTAVTDIMHVQTSVSSEHSNTMSIF